jgi:pimeloyl-ACP methyl ester carboxylesterase
MREMRISKQSLLSCDEALSREDERVFEESLCNRKVGQEGIRQAFPIDVVDCAARRFFAAALFVAGTLSCSAQPSLPSSFQAKTIHSPADTDIFVRYGGHAPVVVLLHGYAENSDSWAPLAEDLMKDHTVVVPDLRGIGRSSKPTGGDDKKTQAQNVRAVVTALGHDRTFVVAHDIGNMVAYAYAATYPEKVERLVVMDAPIPGIDPWNEVLQNPGVWHFNFHGPDAERLVQGRERIYFDRIWNDFTGNPSKPDETTRDFFAATYAQPGGMRASFAQFSAFSQDAKDNKIFEQTGEHLSSGLLSQ